MAKIFGNIKVCISQAVLLKVSFLSFPVTLFDRLASGPPDLRCCLLHQKLQVNFLVTVYKCLDSIGISFNTKYASGFRLFSFCCCRLLVVTVIHKVWERGGERKVNIKSVDICFTVTNSNINTISIFLKDVKLLY